MVVKFLEMGPFPEPRKSHNNLGMKFNILRHVDINFEKNAIKK